MAIGRSQNGACRSASHAVANGFTRRTMIQAGSVSLLGLGMDHVAALKAADSETTIAPITTAKSVIFIFLSGGLSQIDSFDPKPDAPIETRGEFATIATQTPGVQVCEHMPMLAARSSKWSLVRTISHPHTGHQQGHTAMLTCRSVLPPGYDQNKPQSTDWPSVASIIGSALPRRNNNLPPAVVLPERLIQSNGRVIPGQFGGMMGGKRDPWFVEAAPFNPTSYGAYPEYEFHFMKGRIKDSQIKFQSPNLSLPQGLTRDRLMSRDSLLKGINEQRQYLDSLAKVSSFSQQREAAFSLLTDTSVQKAFDVHGASPETLDRYGRNSFGWSLIMARQLVETGVNLVQVNLGNDETWDTHWNNFPLLKDCLLPPMDRAVSALLDDLSDSGLLNETLVVMCSEMGRTPRINVLGKEKPGRDHWGMAQSVMFAGGGIPGGVVVGATDRVGAYPINNSQTPENMAATIYNAMGIPDFAAWHDESDRPHHVYSGEPIQFV